MKDVSKKTIKLTIELPEQRIIDMFIGACEGGSNYWCQSVTPLGPDSLGAYGAMLGGFTCVEIEGGKKHKVSAKDIANAIVLMANKHPNHFGDMVGETDDASTADVFLQLCVLKDLIYG